MPYKIEEDFYVTKNAGIITMTKVEKNKSKNTSLSYNINEGSFDGLLTNFPYVVAYYHYTKE